MNKIDVKAFLISVMALSAAGKQAYAYGWSNVLVCEGGAAVVEVNTSERRQVQVVFRGEDMLRRMRDAGFAWPKFGDQSYAIQGQHAELQPVSPTATQPVSLGGVFYPHDFRNMISERDASAIGAEYRGSDLILKRFEVTQGTSCTRNSDGECIADEVFHKTYFFKGEYSLRGCRLN